MAKKFPYNMLDFIRKWKLNQAVIANRMDMPVSTFKNKINPNQSKYYLTTQEQERLFNVLMELSSDLEEVLVTNI